MYQLKVLWHANLNDYYFNDFVAEDDLYYMLSFYEDSMCHELLGYERIDD